LCVFTFLKLVGNPRIVGVPGLPLLVLIPG